MVPSHQRVNREGTIPLWGEILGPEAIQPWQDALILGGGSCLDDEGMTGSSITGTQGAQLLELTPGASKKNVIIS